jgi:hypothetical protein
MNKKKGRITSANFRFVLSKARTSLLDVEETVLN